MSDEIQVRSECTNGCVNGNICYDDDRGDMQAIPCNGCGGKGYTYRWVTFEEAGISIQQPAEAT